MKPKQSTTAKGTPIPRVPSKVIRDTSRDSKLAQEILHRFGPARPTKPGTQI
jgi:hypothetical protein